MERDKFTCFHCQKVIQDIPHIDHLWPVSKGGSNYSANLVASCAKCNLLKGSKIISRVIEFQTEICRRSLLYGVPDYYGDPQIDIDKDLWSVIDLIIIKTIDDSWMAALDHACLMSPWVETRCHLMIGISANGGRRFGKLFNEN